MKILVINGPNLNMLGIREPEIYGKATYKDLLRLIKTESKKLSVTVKCVQSNSEGKICDYIQKSYKKYDGIVINPAGYTHTSVAILDALKAVKIPAVEVHISEVSEREDFRQVSYVRRACFLTVTGQGFNGYISALKGIKEKINYRK